MKIIKILSEKIEDELDDACEYAKMAMEYKDTMRQLADVFQMLSQEEMKHMNALHTEVVKIIEEYRKTNGDPPVSMQAVYDYLHAKHIERAAEVKRYQDLYKNMQ